MRWSINKNGMNTGEEFDDGVIGPGPGDEDFTRDLIDAHLESLGKDYTADFMGQSWPAADPAE